MKKTIQIFLLLFILISPLHLHAEEEHQEQQEQKDSLHKAIDREYRLSKENQSEIDLIIGNYLGDETHNSWIVGSNYFFHINNTIAFGGSYSYTPIYTDWNSTFGQSVRTKHQHLMDAQIMISNDAAVKIGKSIIECDLYMTLGAGTMWINHSFEPMGILGGGIKIYTKYPWLAVRFDVNSYFHSTPNPTGDTINSDIGMLTGISFLFPTKIISK